MDVTGNQTRFQKTLKEIYKYRYLLLMLLPGMIYYIVFRYGPLYGIQIAFKDYKFRSGIMGSEWVGLEHFQRNVQSNTTFGRCLKIR
jgi:putative aldouronate transport system permease protein